MSAQLPIIHLDDFLIVTVQQVMDDHGAIDMQAKIGDALEGSQARGLVIDLTVLDLVDSFMGRVLNDIAAMAQLMGAVTVVAGLQPAVAITLVELGLELRGVHTALNAAHGVKRIQQLLAEGNSR